MLKAAQNYVNNAGWSETFHKAVVLDPTNWNVVRNSTTSAIMGKDIVGLLYGKYPKGNCAIVVMWFRSSYEGNGKYSDNIRSIGFVREPYSSRHYMVDEILCNCIIPE